MGYISFFQFLRRCLLLDAEKHTLPQGTFMETKKGLRENGTEGSGPGRREHREQIRESPGS